MDTQETGATEGVLNKIEHEVEHLAEEVTGALHPGATTEDATTEETTGATTEETASTEQGATEGTAETEGATEGATEDAAEGATEETPPTPPQTDPQPETAPTPPATGLVYTICPVPMGFLPPTDDLPKDAPFTTLRVGLKWNSLLSIGMLVKATNGPEGKGDEVGTFVVTSIEVVPTYQQALNLWAHGNHLNKPIALLDELVRKAYGQKAIWEAKGFTIVGLKAAPAPAEL